MNHQRWEQTVTEIAQEYDIPVEAVEAALAYYLSHRVEIDTLVRIEQEIEARHVQA